MYHTPYPLPTSQTLVLSKLERLTVSQQLIVRALASFGLVIPKEAIFAILSKDGFKLHSDNDKNRNMITDAMDKLCDYGIVQSYGGVKEDDSTVDVVEDMNFETPRTPRTPRTPHSPASGPTASPTLGPQTSTLSSFAADMMGTYHSHAVSYLGDWGVVW